MPKQYEKDKNSKSKSLRRHVFCCNMEKSENNMNNKSNTNSGRSCHCKHSPIVDSGRHRGGKNDDFRQQVSFSTTGESEVNQRKYTDLAEVTTLQRSMTSKAPSTKFSNVLHSHHENKYTSYHPQAPPQIQDKIAPKKTEPDGQEVIQVVEELMEQTCILKGRLVEMIDLFQKNKNSEGSTKLYSCKKSSSVADPRSTASDSDICSSYTNSGSNNYKILKDESDMRRQKGGFEMHQESVNKNPIETYPTLTSMKMDPSESDYKISNNVDLTEKIVKVQRDLEELQGQMKKITTGGYDYSKNIKGFCEIGPLFTATLSSQLLGKADEIKELLKDLKIDYYNSRGNSHVTIPENDQQKLSQRYETEIKRTHPEFVRTINQKQSIQGDRYRQGNIQKAKMNEFMETNVDTMYNDDERQDNFYVTQKSEKNERIQKNSSDDRHRQASSLTERTVRKGEKSYREVNTIKENDVLYPEGRIIKTRKKTVRTEIVEGGEPQEKIITNIRVKRTIDNRTGEMNEVFYENEEDSDNEEEEQEVEIIEEPISQKSARGAIIKKTSFANPLAYESSKRIRTGEERLVPKIGSRYTQCIGNTSSGTSISVLVEKKPYDDEESYYPMSSVKSSARKFSSKVPTSRSSKYQSSVGSRKNLKTPKDEQYRPNQMLYNNNDRRLIERQQRNILIESSQNPLFYNNINPKLIERQERNTLIESTQNPESTCSRIHYVAKNSEIPGKNLIGCKLPDNNDKSMTIEVDRQSQKTNELNLGGKTDSFFVEVVNDESSDKTTQQRHTGDMINSEASISSVEVENIPNVITQIIGNRTSKEFFISVLPEKIHSKTFRINVIDKENGNLLGFFHIDEDKFHRAQTEGIFDNYLSLYVLNSLGSFTAFRDGVNPKVLKRHQCFGNCACKDENEN